MSEREKIAGLTGEPELYFGQYVTFGRRGPQFSVLILEDPDPRDIRKTATEGCTRHEQ